MFCVHCGKQISDDSKFCVHCGKSCTPAAPVQRAPAAPVQRASAPQPQKAPAAPVQAAPRKSDAGKPIIIGIVIALLLAVLGFGGYYVVTEFVIPALEEQEDSDSGRNNQAEEEDDFTKPSRDDQDVDVTPTPSGDGQSEEPGLSADNPYRGCFEQYSDYVLPNSDSRYYSYSDISDLSGEELAIAYREIRARHGGTFSDADLREYFEARDWYHAGGDSYDLNSYELSNLTLIEVCEDMRSGELYTSGNPYIKLYRNADYAIASSNTRYLRSSDLAGLSEDALYVAGSEILARHGCIFEDETLQAYFYSKSWYQPSVPENRFNTNLLNQYEITNLTLFDSYGQGSEYEVSGAYWSPDNPYKSIYESYGRSQVYFFPDSSSRLLTSADIAGMNIDELCLARNEIWARNGYLFGDDHLREYFQHFTWYHPTTAMGDQDAVSFNSVEYDNIRFLRARQSELESQ